MRTARLLAFVVALCLGIAGARAQGGERILNFVSDVRIERSGDLDVTETIRLVSLGNEIRRGIQRDFPTSYRNGLGQRTTTGFDIVSVARDGQTEPYELIHLVNGMRVRIGRAEVMLPPGEHSYVIRYRSTRQIAYGKENDELYWNATGNGWTFPIDQAEARITLPTAAAFGARAAYTGPQGSTAHNASVIAERPGLIVFRTTAPLPRENGLTVAASFPKGVLAAPGAMRGLRWWLSDWGTLAAGIAAIALLLAYYVRAWLLVGRNPRAGTIVPQFTPPEGLSAAATRYIARMKLDDRAFSAAIVELAVRGHLRIRKEGEGWFSHGTTTLDHVPGGRPLPAPEAAMAASLFDGADQVELKQANHTRLQAARAALSSGLEAAYCDTLFRRNRGWAVYGALAVGQAVVALALIATLLRLPAPGRGELTPALIAMGLFALAWWLRGLAGRSKGTAAGLASIGMVLLVIVGAFTAFGAVGAALAAGNWAVLLPLIVLPIALSAFAWMYAPTPAGRIAMDRIDGFRRYLGVTEEARLEALHPPEKTPELFERYLPYAIALDVENHWAKRFSGVLASAAAAGGAGAAMGWYSGSGNVWDDPGGFAGDVGSSLASTISSASSSPSSGSGGGGSSGGGGGGGGGSGW